MKWVLLLLTFLACFFSSISKATDEKSLLLSIGIGEFADPFWQPLQYAAKDADDIKNFLTTKSSPAFVSIGEQTQGRLTRSQILSLLNELHQANTSENDRVILYISAHGTVAWRNDATIGRFIVGSDTDHQQLTQTAIAYDDLIAAFRKLKSRKKALILAFCHSGTGKSQLTPAMLAVLKLNKGTFPEPETLTSEGSLILAASGWSEAASEDAQLQNDIYTYFLLQGMAEDSNNDGMITLSEAHAFATEATVQRTGGRQRPSAIMETLGGDPIVISGQAKTQSGTLYALYGWLAHLTVQINKGAPTAVGSGVTLPGGVALVDIRNPQTGDLLASRTLVVAPGQEFSLRELLNPQSPYGFSAGATTQSFLPKRVRDGYAKQAAFGIELGFTQELPTLGWRAHLLGAWFPQLSEEIEVQGTQFSQERDMTRFRTGLSYPWLRMALANRQQTEIRSGLTASLLFVRRRVASTLFHQNSSSILMPGLGFLTEMSHISANQHWHLSLQLHAGFWRNGFDTGTLSLPDIGASTTLGYRL